MSELRDGRWEAVRQEDTGRGPVMEDVVFIVEKFDFYAAECLDPGVRFVFIQLITLCL